MNTETQKSTAPSTMSALLFAGLLVIIGLALAGGGLLLISLGGSFYYVSAGVLWFGSGVLLWRGSVWGERLFATMLAFTLLWSLWESGVDFWALLPRLLLPAVVGLGWLLPPVRRHNKRNERRFISPALMSLLIFLALTISLFKTPTTLLKMPMMSERQANAPGLQALADSSLEAEWRNYGNTLSGTRFSPLAQINVGNVQQLRTAWVYRTGETPDLAAGSQATPLKVGDLLYTCTPHNVVIALDAATGAEHWRFKPMIEAGEYQVKTCRGVSYHRSVPDAGQSSEQACTSRIFAATMDGRLLALDAETGALCKDFGDGGGVSLLEGLGGFRQGYQYTTSPPTVVNEHVIIGGLVFDNQGIDVPSGVIRAFHPVTGELQWAWDMGRPARSGAPAAGEVYTRGTANSWSIFSADEQLGLVYVPMGNPSPDFFGGERRPFDEQYGSAVVALDIDNGRPRWSFQTVHHDLWDYDVPAQPVLVDLPDGDQFRPVLVQATKQGDIYVLDRRTGEPVIPVTERPVPQGAVAGDHTSATQPFSALTLAPPALRESAMWGITPLDQMVCRIKFRRSRYDGIYTPPGEDTTIVLPGYTGTVNWGSLSVNEDSRIAIANSMAFPWRINLVRRTAANTQKLEKEFYPMRDTPFAAIIEPFLGPLEVPCSQPPWGFLSAIDLNSGAIVWRRVLGSGRDSGPLGIPSMIPLDVGVPNLGGTVSTRGGLSFISGTLDQYVRAFDQRTGDELWRARLPAGAQSTPMTYTAGGRQYLLVTAGGHPFMDTRRGDYIIAYALPDIDSPGIGEQDND